jgi:hypothetical protein
MAEAAATGSVEHCVRKIQESKNARADEVARYGRTPKQNESRWRPGGRRAGP